jgi:hypothetical protein
VLIRFLTSMAELIRWAEPWDVEADEDDPSVAPALPL